MQALSSLRMLLNDLPHRLKQISDAQAARKSDPSKWSPKQEMGHLLDSAVNNHRRIVLTQLEDSPALPDYDGGRWVEVQRYEARDWNQLVDLWFALNQQLLAAAEAISESGWNRTCTIGDSKPLTLQFVVEDYVNHMLHHLRHIGIEVEDLIAA
jgi:hypothetical protein